MNNLAKNTELSTEPDSEFRSLLNALRTEANEAKNLTKACAEFIGKLSPMCEQPEIDKGKPQPMGIISVFWEEVQTLRESNERMREILNHLHKVIGS